MQGSSRDRSAFRDNVLLLDSHNRQQKHFNSFTKKGGKKRKLLSVFLINLEDFCNLFAQNLWKE